MPHLLDLRLEAPDLTLQFPNVLLPIPLGAEHLRLESADDVLLAAVAARLAGGDGHRSRDRITHVADRDEIRA